MSNSKQNASQGQQAKADKKDANGAPAILDGGSNPTVTLTTNTTQPAAAPTRPPVPTIGTNKPAVAAAQTTAATASDEDDYRFECVDEVDDQTILTNNPRYARRLESSGYDVRERPRKPKARTKA